MTTTRKSAKLAIAIERVYARSPQPLGRAFLVDGLWPRGLRRSDLAGVTWSREVAPSAELRKWFSHRVERWAEFRRRYQLELRARPEAWESLSAALLEGPITLLFAARDTKHNNAVVLRDFLRRQSNRRATPLGRERAVGSRRSGSTRRRPTDSSQRGASKTGRP